MTNLHAQNQEEMNDYKRIMQQVDDANHIVILLINLQMATPLAAPWPCIIFYVLMVKILLSVIQMPRRVS